jgi:hypothetical protein
MCTNEDYEVVDTYKGEETTIYYDAEGDQHVEVNDDISNT